MALQMQESVTNKLLETLLWQNITHVMLLSVCEYFKTESQMIMSYWEHFQQIP